jgi:hypothetical protein
VELKDAEHGVAVEDLLCYGSFGGGAQEPWPFPLWKEWALDISEIIISIIGEQLVAATCCFRFSCKTMSFV